MHQNPRNATIIIMAIGMKHTFTRFMIDLKGGKGAATLRGIRRDDTSSDDQRKKNAGVGESEKEVRIMVNEK